MPVLSARGVDLYCEWDGPTEAPALILTRGLGTQLIDWPEAFWRGFVAAGFRVVRYDNRDTGLSQKMGSCEVYGEASPAASYGLFDMAADVISLLDALEIDKAHLLGISMGGMISQAVAADHPHRVRSLTSVMSSSGEVNAIAGPEDAVAALFEPWPKGDQKEAAIAKMARDAALYGSPAFPISEEVRLAAARAAVERCYCPGGMTRQRAAMQSSGSRSHLLSQIRCPTLVIHGDGDPLIPLESGERAARLIPGASLKVYRGMGHDLPGPLLGQMVQVVTDHCRAAEAL